MQRLLLPGLLAVFLFHVSVYTQSNTDTEICDDWSQWSPCTATCSDGTTSRTKDCVNELNNTRTLSETGRCNAWRCDEIYDWAKWQPCDCKSEHGSTYGWRRRYEKETKRIERGEVLREFIPCLGEHCTSNDTKYCGASDLRSDVLFLMDSSRDNSPLDWYNTKQLFADVALNLPLGSDFVRVAAMSYSTYTRTDFSFDYSYDRVNVANTIFDADLIAGDKNLAEALRVAQNQFREYGRPNVRHYIILTMVDTPSNLESESVEEMATLTKSHGIEIIGVGVGYNVKVPMELLLKVISTTPDRRDYFYGVQKFIQIYDRDLSHIESMAQYICVRALPGGVDCTEWTPWGECDRGCGGGKREREFSCTVDEFERQYIETERCNTHICVECSFGDLTSDTSEMVDPSDCTKYYECKILPNGGVEKIRRDCPTGTFYNSQSTLCTFTHNGDCIELSTTKATGTTAPTTTTAAPKKKCKAKVVKNKPTKYKLKVNGNWLTQSCAPGTVFDFGDACTCVFPTVTKPPTSDCQYTKPADGNVRAYVEGTTVHMCAEEDKFDFVVCECVVNPNYRKYDCSETILYFPFDEDYVDDCPQAAISNHNGKLAEGVIGTGVLLSQKPNPTHLEASFINDWFSWNDIDKFTVSLWVRATKLKKSEKKKLTMQGIINNGDCNESPGFGIHIRNGTLGAAVATGALNTPAQYMLSDDKLKDNTWTHLALVYDGAEVRLYKDAFQIAKMDLDGYLSNRRCPLVVGNGKYGNDRGYFDGSVDELKLMKAAWTVSDIIDEMNRRFEK